MENRNFYNYTAEEVEIDLGTDTETGLSDDEVLSRYERYGYNEFEKVKHKSLFVKFIDQFKSFMIIVLLAAAIISGVVGYLGGEGFTDAVIILMIVILNACIGVIQEAKAEKSLDALEKLSSPHSKVIRNGGVHVVEARELVPGDIVVLETGDSVPADLRLIEAVNLKIEEASLTGESVPSEKNIAAIEGEVPLGDRNNMAYASTSVTYGRGKGIVTGTGMTSEVGKIASMIQSVPDMKTPMQIRLDKLGKTLAIAAIAVCALIFVIGMLYGRGILDMFMIAVSLAAAAIPEGLPAVSTIVLAIGVQRLVKRHAIVRKLPSVETLGSTQVICSDKTGTLTQNRMTITAMYTDGAVVEVSDLKKNALGAYGELIKTSIMVNDATLTDKDGGWKVTGDPTETSMLDLGLKFNILKHDLDREFPRVCEEPFDSERKLMTSVHKRDGKFFAATKGGTDELLARCDRIKENGEIRPLTAKDKENIAAANLQMAGNALRVLAVGTKESDTLPDNISSDELENGLVFIGLLGMIDPPRDEVRVAVAKCRTAGIKPVMITGDHKITAVAIARSLGIMNEGDLALTGLELDKMSDEELNRNIEKIAVYARVSPEDKVRIVKAFQKHEKVVAMTGDGVNDAPALKLADIGVAMGIVGTDVSKEAADIVLTDDNFATIVTAVEEGRRIYDNILKVIKFLLSANIGELLVLFVAVIFNWVTPLLPIHILWINLVTDSLPALALSVDPAAPDVMSRKPIDPRKGILTREFSTILIVQGVMIAALSLIAYSIGLKTSPVAAQTMTFAVLTFSQLMLVFSVRTGRNTAFKGMFTNKHLLLSLAIVTAMMFAVLEIPALQELFRVTPMSGIQRTWVILLSFAPLLMTEIVKYFMRLFGKKNGY